MKKFIAILLLTITVSVGQPPRSENKDFKFVFEPDSVSLNVGESKNITVRVVDSEGKQAKMAFMVRGQRKAISVEPE